MDEYIADANMGAGYPGSRDELDQMWSKFQEESALNEVIQTSRINLEGQSAPQTYVQDTREILWTPRANSAVTTTVGEAEFVSTPAYMMDLATVRVYMRLTVNCVAKAGAPPLWAVANAWPQIATKQQLLVGINQLPAAASDSININRKYAYITRTLNNKNREGLLNMADQGFSITQMITPAIQPNSGGVGVANGSTALVAADFPATLLDSTQVQATPYAMTFDAIMRPDCGLFDAIKLWPPNVPIVLKFNWDATTLTDIILNIGGSTVRPSSVSLQIFRVESSQIQLKPSFAQYIDSSTDVTAAMQSQYIAMNRGQNSQQNKEALQSIDPRFKTSEGKPYQYLDMTVKSFTYANAQQIQNSPVIMGIKPTLLGIFIVPNSLPYKTRLASTWNSTPGGVATSVQSINVTYNGLTYFPIERSPVNEQLQSYEDTKMALNEFDSHDSQFGLTYAEWLNGNYYFMFNLRRSRITSETEEAEGGGLTINMTLTQPDSGNVFYAMGYDQTLNILRNTNCQKSLPAL